MHHKDGKLNEVDRDKSHQQEKDQNEKGHHQYKDKHGEYERGNRDNSGLGKSRK